MTTQEQAERQLQRRQVYFFRFALAIIALEIVLLLVHFNWLRTLAHDYLWLAPLAFFKASIKRMLVMNFLGILKVLWLIFANLLKLVVLKILKILGIRYSVFFSQLRWSRFSARVEYRINQLRYAYRDLNLFLARYSRWQLTVIVIAFLPIFIFLFLCGLTFEITRKSIVKKGSEIGATKTLLSTARQSRGLVALLNRLDERILKRIARLTGQQT